MPSQQILSDIEWLQQRYKGDAHGYADAALGRISAALKSWEQERDEMALKWSDCAMRNAIKLREIQLLAADGLETGCVEGDDEYTLFTSIHRLACEGQSGDAEVNADG